MGIWFGWWPVGASIYGIYDDICTVLGQDSRFSSDRGGLNRVEPPKLAAIFVRWITIQTWPQFICGVTFNPYLGWWIPIDCFLERVDTTAVSESDTDWSTMNSSFQPDMLCAKVYGWYSRKQSYRLRVRETDFGCVSSSATKLFTSFHHVLSQQVPCCQTRKLEARIASVFGGPWNHEEKLP